LTDARSLQTAREVDGFGEVIQEVSPDRGTRLYWYDLDSNLSKLVDGDSVETDFTYDNASRLLTKTFPSDTAENTTFTYDQTAGGNFGIGRLTNVAEASGSTSFTYDAQGRVIDDSKVISGGGYSTPFLVAYAYDANGKATQITYPSGTVVGITRTTDGLVAKVVETPSGHPIGNTATNVLYEPYGAVASFTYGNNLNRTDSYNQDYELTETKSAPSSGAALFDLSFSWQTDGRVAGVTDNVSGGVRSATYGYTAAGRVQTAGHLVHRPPLAQARLGPPTCL